MCINWGDNLSVYEYFVFSHYYNNAIALVESERLDILVVSTWDKINQMSENGKVNITDLNLSVTPLIKELDRLHELKNSCLNGYSNQVKTLDLIEHYEAKLTTLYGWLNSMGFSLINKRQRVLQDDRVIAKDALCN